MKGIEIISIPVTDQQRSKKFYQDVGFTLVTEAPFDKNQKWVQLSLPQGPSITLVTWFKKMPAGTVQGLVIETENLEKEIERLHVKGITVGKIDFLPWGKFAGLEDPDGNGLSLHQKNE